jgi:TetR/AcrR family transcriptional regulator, transcriptional repressor for nem operon
MPYPPSHREKVKETIVASAQRLFNRRGFSAVSIDDIMAAAGLTRGSFYTYFDSKSALYAESVNRVLGERLAKRNARTSTDPRASDAAVRLVRNYLSRRHVEDRDGDSPMIGLPGDVAHADARVRLAFGGALRLMADILEQGLHGNVEEARNRALAISALCVGGMVLARSIEDRGLADEVCEAALAIALSLGDWT